MRLKILKNKMLMLRYENKLSQRYLLLKLMPTLAIYKNAVHREHSLGKILLFFIQKYILLKKFIIILFDFWVFFTLTFYYLKIWFPQIRFQIHAYLSQSCLYEWSE